MDPLRQVQPYMRDDEQLLWYGGPDPDVRFSPGDGFLIPFSIAWCAFAIFWEAGVATSGGPVVPEIFGIPFIAIGLYAVAGRFFYKRYRKARTVYAITTRRAIVAGPRSFADLPLRDQRATIQRSGDSRHASVIIGDAGLPGRGRRRQSPWWYGNTGMELLGSSGLPFAFYDVARPDVMLRALDQARSPSLREEQWPRNR